MGYRCFGLSTGFAAGIKLTEMPTEPPTDINANGQDFNLNEHADNGVYN